MSHFWTYTVWYVLLANIAVIQLAFIYTRADNRRLALGFWLTLAGIALIFETVILIFFRAYEYYPMLLQTSPFPFDRILAGSLFSQFLVAATALLVAVLDLGWIWWAALALLYGLVEEGFTAFGVYAQNWYDTWMTVAALPVYFGLAKILYAALRRGAGQLIHYGCVALALFPLYVVTVVWAFMLSGHLAFSTALFGDPVISRYFLAMAVYIVPAGAAMMLVRFAGWPWSAKAALTAALYLFYYECGQYGLIIIREGWFMTVTTATTAWAYASVLLLDRLYADVKRPGR